jgi:hypothetical protein
MHIRFLSFFALFFPRVGAGVVLGWVGTLASPRVPLAYTLNKILIPQLQRGRLRRPAPMLSNPYSRCKWYTLATGKDETLPIPFYNSER